MPRLLPGMLHFLLFVHMLASQLPACTVNIPAHHPAHGHGKTVSLQLFLECMHCTVIRLSIATFLDRINRNQIDVTVDPAHKLCQLCGIPMNQEITLADEDKESLALSGTPVDTEQQKVAAQDSALNTRPELRMLQNALDISKEATKMVRAINLPHVMLTGGYMISNPNVFNGFQKKFTGVWNVGVMVHVPVWNWFDGAYKVRAAKAASNIAQMNLDDTREKIHLQITQSQFKVKEAQKKLNMAMKNIASAEENLRCANLGFKEGVMEVTDVMAAQTAWQKAQSQKIDAEIDVKLTQVGLNKALGILQ